VHVTRPVWASIQLSRTDATEGFATESHECAAPLLPVSRFREPG
jgi:hypothetical protein